VDRRVHRRGDRRREPGRAGRADRTTAFPTECPAGSVPDRRPPPDSHPDIGSSRCARAAPAADPYTTLRCSREAHRPSRADPVAHPTGAARADRVTAAYHHSDVDGVGEPHHPGPDPVTGAITDHPPDDPPDDPTTHDTHRDPNRNADVDPNVHPDGNGNSDDLPDGYGHPQADADVQSHVVIDATSNAFPVPHPQPVTAAPTRQRSRHLRPGGPRGSRCRRRLEGRRPSALTKRAEPGGSAVGGAAGRCTGSNTAGGGVEPKAVRRGSDTRPVRRRV